MNSEAIIDENALDSEALQAQIDLSMSFAQDLVTSWIQPHTFPKTSRKKDLEKELTDYMHRPPRLGVGASVPQGHQSTSREIARLKGKLTGSKRSREEEATTSKQSSDDEGESKASAIKKKARADPFDVVHGKKKKQKKVSQESLPSPMVVDQPKDDSSGEVEDILLNSPKSPTINGSNLIDSTPISSKKKRKMAKKAEEELISSSGQDPTSVKKFVAGRSSTPLHSSGKSTYIFGLVQYLITAVDKEPVAQDMVDNSLTSTPRNISPSKKTALDLFKIPLLNLTGPPNELDSDSGSETGTPSTSPKKKRKRRKKKKSNAAASASDAMTSTKTIPI